MDCYLDIHLLPDAELSSSALMNNLFAKLHRALVQHANGDIATSFPEYGQTLGKTLRLHGIEEALDGIMAQPWLKGLRDYTSRGDMLAVPTEVKGYRVITRVQQNTPNNLRKRSITKGWHTEDQARHLIPDSKFKRLSLPFIQLRSHSTRQEFYLFINRGTLQNHPTTGRFSCYGLSQGATVPCF